MFQTYIPSIKWIKKYNLITLYNDSIAAFIVTIMLIPQSLAYAMLAGLPPEIGLYASIAPLIFYAIFGTSSTLSVGPVAVASLLTASAISGLGLETTEETIYAAISLALLSGLILIVMGVLKFGFLANFLSHPVISGFISASGILIAASQIKHIFGIEMHGHNIIDIVQSFLNEIHNTNYVTLTIGIGTLSFLLFTRTYLENILKYINIKDELIKFLVKLGPVFAIVLTTILSSLLNLSEKSNLDIVGDIPEGLPTFTKPVFDFEIWNALLVPAILISIIGFVESISVAKTLGAKKQEKINSNQELIGLGSANIASSLSSGFPVTGGFSRSVVNFDAGAKTQLAGILTAFGIGLSAMYLTDLLYHLPIVTLASTIIVAVLSLIDISIFKKTFLYDKVDFIAVITTIALTLLQGVEIGVTTGVIVSLLLFVYKTSKPHIAEIGLVNGTEHFRNIKRYKVSTQSKTIMIRVDESLYFANASFLEDYIVEKILLNPETKNLIISCSAVNDIDISGLETLENINTILNQQDIKLHMAEIKGPVMDKIKKTNFLDHLSGKIFFNQYQAFAEFNQ
jgi:SulP family sulfate permease